MKQKLLMILCLPLVLAACGKGDGAPAGSGAQAVSSNAVGTPPPPGATFPQIEENHGHFKVAYSFFENGCYTGRQRISGYDRESTRQRLCERLQDDWANRGCARNLRFSYFANICSGRSWNPR